MIKKKYNNKSNKFSDWTTKKLKDEYISYDELINVIKCYGVKDIMHMDGIARELDNRGVEIKSRIFFD